MQLDQVLLELKKVRNPHNAQQIEIIEKFLAELSHYISYSRIHEVVNEVIVEKEVDRHKVVSVPVED